MSLFGMMRTSVSGMQAQANRLSAVADNIANSDTTGYKRYSTEFSQLVSPGVQSSNSSTVGSGGVLTDLRQAVSQQGTLSYTNSSTDLAIDGAGFFVVKDPAGTPYLTRAGSFVANGDGNLVNSSGMLLTGYSLENGPASAVANGFEGLEPISIVESDLISEPTTAGKLQTNLPSTADVVTGNIPSDNLATSTFSEKTSLVVYDNLGEGQLVDVYFTKTAVGAWDVTVFNQQDASSVTGFPYSSAPLSTTQISFDLTDGTLATTSPNTVSFAVPGGSNVDLDIAGMTQLAVDYTVFEAEVNGNAPSPITEVSIDEDGVLFARYADGSFRSLYQIPLASVTSPDQLSARTGSIFLEGTDSGSVQIGFPNNGLVGKIVPSALEQSNVDLANELTSMIQSQRGYTANSKVFQTGSDLMDVLVNLKR